MLTTPRLGAYTLVSGAGQPFLSNTPGTLGGNRASKIFGRLHCPAALRAIARGGYAQHRVFFVNATEAAKAGYRPCAVCLPVQYKAWRIVTRGRRTIDPGI